MKKNYGILIILILVMTVSMVIAGCSSEGPGEEKVGENIEIIFGHEFSIDSPQQDAILKFKEQVEEESEGQIEVSVFPASQMGNARELFEALQVGSVHISTIPTARISGFAPQLQIFDLPFLFEDEESRIEILDGEVGEELLSTLDPQRVKGIAFYDDGNKQMTANKPLRTLDDFKGIKFRTMESPIIIEQYTALGADPVPIEYAELYNSLQLNVVDGQENPIIHIYDNKFNEVQDYIMLTNHAPLSGVLLFSTSWFDDLSEEVQNILLKAGENFAVNFRENIKQTEQSNLDEMEEDGLEVITLTDGEIEAFREATLPVHEIYIEEHGDEIINKIYEAMDKE